MKRWVCGVLSCVLVVSGCGMILGQVETEAPALPPIQAESTTVQAEGRVEPVRWVTLRAAAAAQVGEVTVEEGASVSAGDALIAFDAADIALSAAQAEAALQVAESQVALVRAGARAEALALMDAQVAAATAVVSQSAALLDSRFVGETQAEVAAAEADILAARVAHDAADDAHDDTMKCYNVTQEDGSKREICPTLGTFEEMARAQMEATYARLEAAQAGLEAAKRVGWAETEVFRADVGVAQANLAMTQAARVQAAAVSRGEEVRLAEAAVAEAAAAMEGVQEQLAAMTVSAPFDATASSVDVNVGETVAAGAPLVTLATLDQLRIRTRDLTELNVVRTAVGQPVAVRADAYPGAVFAARVAQIQPQSSDYLGDVTYDVIIELEEIPDWLRWGMVVDVEIGAEAVATASIVPVAVPPSTTIAEAAVVPAAEIAVGSQLGGRVAGVHVDVGQEVNPGDVLLTLDGGCLRVALQQAEAALATAQADLALIKAPPLPEAVAAAQVETEVAQAELVRAVAQRNHLSAQLGEAQTAAVEAELAEAKARRREVEAYLHWAEGDEDSSRIAEWRLKLAAVNQEIAAIELHLEALPGARWAQLRAAGEAVRAAEAQVAVADAKLSLAEAGPVPEAIAVAAAQVRQHELAVDAARLQLARAEVRAPVAGTVAVVSVEAGETVTPGRVLVSLASLDQLEIRTYNLMEVDVVSVVVGALVTLKLDALPDLTLSGRVAQVGWQEEIYRGDVTYPVVVALGEQPESLRWGMTALVEISH